MYFPSDWPLPLRRIVRRAYRKLCNWEDEYGEAAPLGLVARYGSRCVTQMCETLPELYADEIPESWWERWQAGQIGRETYLLLCGEDPKPVRKNGAQHNYLRRVPTISKNRNYRYIYDPKKAFPKKRKVGPRKKEKLKITHDNKRGHYEVTDFEDGKAVVKHDESGHRMRIESAALYELFAAANDIEALSEKEQKALDKLVKKDRLPRSRAAAYFAIQQASDIEDHDSATQDAAYLKWKRNGKRGKKPPPLEVGGLLDAFSGDKRKGKKGAQKPYSSLLEAFEDATKGANTWLDLAPALEKLQQVPGWDNARFPDDVNERHIMQKEILKEAVEVDPENYGEAIEDEASEGDFPSTVDEQGFDWATGEQVSEDDWADEILNDPFYEDPI